MHRAACQHRFACLLFLRNLLVFSGFYAQKAYMEKLRQGLPRWTAAGVRHGLKRRESSSISLLPQRSLCCSHRARFWRGSKRKRGRAGRWRRNKLQVFQVWSGRQGGCDARVVATVPTAAEDCDETQGRARRTLLVL